MKKQHATTIKKEVIIRNAPSKKPKKTRRSKKNGSRDPLVSKIASIIDTNIDDYQYVASIINPWQYRGARIPDENTASSATISSEWEGTIKSFPFASGSGYGAGIIVDVGNLTPNATLPITVAVAGGAAGQYNFSRSASADSAHFAYPNAAGISGTAYKLRMVSCGLAVRPITSTALNSGEQLVFQSETITTRPTLGVYSDFINAYRLHNRCPVNPYEACVISYHSNDHILGDYYQDPGTGFSLGSQYFGTIGFIANGVDANYSAQVSVVVNWEVLPNSAYSGILTTQPSHCSFKARQMAANIQASMLTLKSPNPSLFFGSNPTSHVGAQLGTSSRGMGHSYNSESVRGFVDTAYQVISDIAYGVSAGYQAYRGLKSVTGQMGLNYLPPVPQIEMA